MDPLRLPPLRFSQHEPNRPLNCVLPPITPPPRFSPVSSTWPNSTPVPSPPAARHSPQISNLTYPSPGSLSPPRSQPPTSMPYVQPSSAPLPTAAVLQYPANSLDSSPPVSAAYQGAHHQTPFARPPDTQQAAQAPCKTEAAQPASYSQPLAWEYSAVGNYPQHSSSNTRGNNVDQAYIHLPRSHSVAHYGQYPGMNRTETMGTYSQVRDSNWYPVGGEIVTEPVSPSTGTTARRVPARSPVKRIVKTPRGLRDMYACPYPNCTRLSTEQSNMKAHMRMHTGEKPYICRHAGCMKAFRWKSSLTYHEKALHVKAKPYKCAYCRRSFVEKRKLRMHYDLCPIAKIKREEEEEQRRHGLV